MRILHVIPVGRSLLEQIDRGVLPTLQPALAVDELPDSVDKVREALSQATGQDHELDLNRLGLTGVPRTASALDSSMAAEWTSLKAVAAANSGRRRGRPGGVAEPDAAFVAPSVAERGECLAGWWSADPWSARTLDGDCADLNGGYAEAPAGVLMLMTGWSLAVGLAAQILWDDRPVTAPLGRLRRVRGSTP